MLSLSDLLVMLAALVPWALACAGLTHLTKLVAQARGHKLRAVYVRMLPMIFGSVLGIGMPYLLLVLVGADVSRAPFWAYAVAGVLLGPVAGMMSGHAYAMVKGLRE